MKPVSLFFFLTTILQAQLLSFGVKGGAQLTGDLSSYSAASESKRFTIGPSLTANLPRHWSLEFAALYRRTGLRSDTTDIVGGIYASRYTANAWEFPVVLRRSLWHGLYAGAGYAPRIINGSGHIDAWSVVQISPYTLAHSSTNVPGIWDTTHGLVLAAGIDHHLGPVHLAPEVRYTRWNRPAVDLSGSRGFSIQSSQNQVDLMLNLRWP